MRKLNIILLLLSWSTGIIAQSSQTRVLIFSKTEGFRHQSIEKARERIAALCSKNNIAADSTQDSNNINEKNLKQYKTVIFLNTTGDILNNVQQKAFEDYIHQGGGYVGIHAATDTEYEWPWYGKMAGAYFKSHPKQQQALVKFTDRQHPASEMMPDEWKKFDEWYNYKEVNPDIKVLAYLDEQSYSGGEMNGVHPIVWYHEFEGGRAFYSGFGHNEDTFEDPLFMEHLLGGILYTSGIK